MARQACIRASRVGNDADRLQTPKADELDPAIRQASAGVGTGILLRRLPHRRQPADMVRFIGRDDPGLRRRRFVAARDPAIRRMRRSRWFGLRKRFLIAPRPRLAGATHGSLMVRPSNGRTIRPCAEPFSLRGYSQKEHSLQDKCQRHLLGRKRLGCVPMVSFARTGNLCQRITAEITRCIRPPWLRPF
jgi:hypothetical protein